MMRALHFVLAASVCANLLSLGGFLGGRETRRVRETAEIARTLALDATQVDALRAMRRDLREDLRELRPEVAAASADFHAAARDHGPEAPELVAATRRLGELKARQVTVLLRHELAFRAALRPDQRDRFNDEIGHGRFIYALAGLGGSGTEP